MLTDAGFECGCSPPSRAPNLVARLRGSDGPTLTILGHIDTVRADPEWSRDPWSGELVDGWIWGRGALDMKGQVASEVAACLELGRSGWRPAGELLLVLTADEEAGGGLGAQWLCEITRTGCEPTSSSTRAEGHGSSSATAASTRSASARRDLPDPAEDEAPPATPRCPDRGERAAQAPGTWRRSPNSRRRSRPRWARRSWRRSSASPSPAPRGSGRSRTPTRRGAAARRLPGRADARRHPQSDEGAGRQEGQRDPPRPRP